MLCAMTHSLVATGIAAQQLVALTRAYTHPRRTEVIRVTLFGSAGPSSFFNGARTLKSRIHHFSWQIPTMLLGNSIVFVLVGLGIAVGVEARKAMKWGPDVVTAICFAVSLLFSITCYFISWASIEWTTQDTLVKDDSSSP